MVPFASERRVGQRRVDIRGTPHCGRREFPRSILGALDWEANYQSPSCDRSETINRAKSCRISDKEWYWMRYQLSGHGETASESN